MTGAHTNPLGQPVGPPLPDFAPRQRPRRAPIDGRWCRLEPADPERHAEALWRETRGDERLFTYLPYGPFADPDAYRGFMEERCRADDPLFYAIVAPESDRALGLASYLRIDPAMGVIEIGHLQLSPALQRTTAATEALALLLRHALGELGYRRCEWKCDALNAPSRRAALRLGFRFEGTFRQAAHYKGRSRDTGWFSILDREWPALDARLRRWLAPENFDAQGRQRTRLGEHAPDATAG